MGRRGLSAAIVLTATSLISAVPASAGGSTWEVEPAVVAPGDEVFVWAAVAWAHNDALGTPEDGPWHAWMIPAESNSLPWGQIPERAVHIGDIEVVEGPHRNYGPNHAKFTFTVPDVAPGRYEILHCNDPCTRQLGDITWGVFEVVGPSGDEAEGAAPVAPTLPPESSTSSPSTTTSTTPTTENAESEIDGELAVATSPLDEDGGAIDWRLAAIALFAVAVAVVARRASRRTSPGSDHLSS